jgi:hypothetical protein
MLLRLGFRPESGMWAQKHEVQKRRLQEGLPSFRREPMNCSCFTMRPKSTAAPAPSLAGQAPPTDSARDGFRRLASLPGEAGRPSPRAEVTTAQASAGKETSRTAPLCRPAAHAPSRVPNAGSTTRGAASSEEHEPPRPSQIRRRGELIRPRGARIRPASRPGRWRSQGRQAPPRPRRTE